MNKALILFLIFIFIFVGIYGTYYFLKLQKAEDSINESILNIKEGDYDDALNELKGVISNYDFKIVKAPAIYLLADTYEKSGKYISAIEAHQMLISDKRLSEAGNWYIRSIISLSKLYRKGVIETSKQKTETLKNYLNLMIERVKEERTKNTFNNSVEYNFKRLFNSFLKLNYDLAIKDVSYDELLIELETELGFIYLQEKKYGKAEDIFIRLNTPISKYGLAQVYLETDEEMKGIKLLWELIKYDTTGKIRSYYIGKSFEYAENKYREKKFAEAIGIFKNIIELTENSEYAELSLYYIATYYYNKNNPAVSMKYLNRILLNSVKSKDEKAQLLKGYIYYDRREFIKALKVFRDFIKKYPYSGHLRTAQEWKSMCERNIKYLG